MKNIGTFKTEQKIIAITMLTKSMPPINTRKHHIHPINQEIRDTIDTDRSALYIELPLKLTVMTGGLRRKHHNKRGYVDFLIVNLTFIM
jgi:hypothetical protein